MACGPLFGHYFIARGLGAPGKKRGFCPLRLRVSAPKGRTRAGKSDTPLENFAQPGSDIDNFLGTHRVRHGVGVPFDRVAACL
jgi:hypothetical protein